MLISSVCKSFSAWPLLIIVQPSIPGSHRRHRANGGARLALSAKRKELVFVALDTISIVFVSGGTKGKQTKTIVPQHIVEGSDPGVTTVSAPWPMSLLRPLHICSHSYQGTGCQYKQGPGFKRYRVFLLSGQQQR